MSGIIQARWSLLLGGTLLLAATVVAGCDGSAGDQDRDEVAALDPDSLKISLEAAEQYLVGGNLNEAEAIGRRMVEAAPESMESHELLGRILIARAIGLRDAGQLEAAREQWKRASQQYERVVRLAPESAGLHQSAGEVAQMAGRTGLAIELYRRAGELDPADPRPALYESQLLLTDRQFAEARAAVARVLAIESDQPHALATLAVIEMEQGNWTAAKDTIASARAGLADDLGIRTIQSRIHRLSGDPERGLELLLALPESSRAGESVTEEIASCWTALGRPEEAAVAWERCDGMRGPRSGLLSINAAEAWLAADRPEEALAWIERAELAGIDAERTQSLRDRLAR